MILLKYILRFPLDVLFLTIDWVRAFWLRIRRRVFRKTTACPFCVLRELHSNSSRICPSALKYSRPSLFRRICSGVTGLDDHRDGLPRCNVESTFSTPGKSILPVGIALLLTWGGIGVLLQTQFGFFGHLHHLVFAQEAPPPKTTEDLASLEARLKRISLQDSRTDKRMAQKYMQDADGHFSAGIYNIASIEYAIALQRDPDLQEAYRQLGLCHLAGRNFKGAEPALKRALEMDPDDLDAHLAMVEVAAALDQSEQAFHHARTLLAIGPGNVQGFLRLVHFHQAMGNRDTAVLAAEEALEAAPEDPKTLYRAATMYSVFGKQKEAEALIQRCLRIDPEHVGALISLAAHRLIQGDLLQAETLLTQVERLDPELLSARSLRAELAGLETNAQAAIDAYQELVRAYPDYHAGANRLAEMLILTRRYDDLYKLAQDLAGRSDPVTSTRGNLLLARLWLTKGFYGLAIETAEEALNAFPQSDPASLILARCHLGRKEYGEALDYLEPLHEKFPGQPVIHLMTIRCMLDQDREQEAEASYQDFLTRHPESAAAVKMMGDYYFEQKDFDKAEQAYQEALEIEPQNAIVRYDLSMLLAENDAGLTRSAALAQQMKAENNENALYFDILGWVYHQQGRSSDAVELLEKAVRQAPGEAVFRYHLGAALADSAPNQAQRHLSIALSISTNFFGAERAQEMLQKIESGSPQKL